MNKTAVGNVLRKLVMITIGIGFPFTSSVFVNPAKGQEKRLDKTKVRELYVPFGDLEALLGADTERVFMSRQEYEELWRVAEKAPPSKPPLEVAIVSADYQADVLENRAIMRGTLTLDVLDDDLHAVPLDFSEVGIRWATLDGSPAKLATNDAGQTLLFVQGVGNHELIVEIVMPVAVDAAQQTIRFGVPKAPSSRIAMKVPGNVEIKSGVSVIDREVDSDQDRTRFEILPGEGTVSLVMSLNNRKTRDTTTVMSRGVVVSEITEAYERLHASLSMTVVSGATEELRFVIDETLEVDQVQCDLMSRWEIQRVEDEKQLVVKLRVPSTERVLVHARLDRGKPASPSWTQPRFEPLDVAGYTAVVGLVTEDRFRVSKIRPTSLYTIDSDVLRHAKAANRFGDSSVATQIKPIAAFYAASADYELKAELNLPSRGLLVNANSLFEISDSGVSVSGGLALTPEYEKLFSFDLLLPPGWSLDWVRDGVESELAFQRYDQANGTRIRVLIPNGLETNLASSVWFKAKYTPANWLNDWETQTLDLPHFLVPAARDHRGVVAIKTVDDLVANPEATDGLVVVSESEKARHQLANVSTALAYQYDTLDWKLSVRFDRLTARQTARVLSFFRIGTEAIASHSELIFLIEQAGSPALRFSLPESTPNELTIRALGGIGIKETSSSLVDGRRHWKVELAERRQGSIHLSVDFSQSLTTTETAEVVLPVIRAESVQYQTGAIALEGHPELNVNVKQSPREIDIGELVDAEYQVGKRLIGSFGYVADDDQILVEVGRRSIHALPSTIVQRAEMMTHVSVQGRSQTAARFRLRTKASSLECVLPDGASLWAVLLDGSPALPQRVGQRLILSLPANAATPLRDLQLVYEIACQPISFRAQIDVFAPRLFERTESQDRGSAIPMADLQWKVYLPPGYRITHTNGRPVPSAKVGSSLDEMGRQFFSLGGGTRFGILRASQMAREAASLQRVDSERALEETRVQGPMEMGSQGIDDFEGVQLEFESMQDSPKSAQIDAIQAPSQPQQKEVLPPAPPSAESANAPATEVEEGGEPSGLQAATAKRKAMQNWTLEGVRSLPIDFPTDRLEESITLRALGDQTSNRLNIINVRRFQWLATLLGLVVFLAGLTIRRWPSRVKFLFGAVVILTLMPPLTGWEMELREFQSPAVTAVIVLVVYYLIQAIGNELQSRRRGRKRRVVDSVTERSMANGLILALVVAWPLMTGRAAAQPDPFSPASATVTDLESLKQLVESFSERPGSRRPPARIPGDAVVIPYDGSPPAGTNSVAGDGSGADEKLLVPYETYKQLLALASPESKRDVSPPPAAYAWSDVRYATTLDGSGGLMLTGRLTLDQFVDDDLWIPLRVGNAVLEKATLDEKPAKLKSVRSTTTPQKAAANNQSERELVPGDSLLLLHSSGRGSKTLMLEMRLGLQKSGGWRIATGAIPTPPASELAITVPDANTEVRLSGITDRLNYSSVDANEVIKTALDREGAFTIRWRDQISEAVIDQGLTAVTKMVFDVREDALRLAWHAEFEFRRGRREMLTVQIPNGYLLEKVLGDNVRGWTTSSKSDGQQVDVELLKPAAERESLTMILSKPLDIRIGEARSVSIPSPVVPGAMLQRGRLTVRKSSLLELKTGAVAGLVRIDLPDESKWYNPLAEPGPLPLRAYQAYEFNSPQFELPIVVDVVQAVTKVEVQSLFKLSQRQTLYESRLLITAVDRPTYQLRIALPSDLELEPPEVPGQFEWAVSIENDQPVLEINLADGQLGQFTLLLKGRLPAIDGLSDAAAAATVDLPKIRLLDSDRQQGAIVVQGDPAYEIRATNLQNCSTARLDGVSEWLQPSQRELARLLIRYDVPNYDGQLSITSKSPKVDNLTVTNVKVTDRAVEETIYIEAIISSAGIDSYSFLLPARLAEARIDAPLIRRIEVTPTGPAEDAPVRVTLEFQDAITGRLGVIVEHDRLLGTGRQTVPLPEIETGQTSSRLLTLENASRDELSTEEFVSVERVERVELAKDQRLSRLGGASSMIFRVRESEAVSNPPRLVYQTKIREIVETVGARIGLAKTLLVIDRFGTYRGTQEYRVENRTEPFLAIRLPDAAQLWTVQVAGENAKPSNDQSGSIQIPLVKTAEGELDYPVVVKYGGSMEPPNNFRKTQFPLIQTKNIQVELSQVRLRLPEQIRWFGFDGTMGRAANESELEAGWLSFRTRQITDLTRLLKSQKGQYSKVRAQYNLKQLERVVKQKSAELSQRASGEGELQQQLIDNAAALEQAEQEIVTFENQVGVEIDGPGNRLLLNEFYGSQTNSRSRDVVSGLGTNFSVMPEKKAAAKTQIAPNQSRGEDTRFDKQWMSSNSLLDESDVSETKGLSGQVAVVDPAKKPAAQTATTGMEERTPPAQQPQSAGGKLNKDMEIAQQQIVGDYRAQADRYRQRLEMEHGQSGNAMGMRMSMDDNMAPSSGGASASQAPGNRSDEGVSLNAGRAGANGRDAYSGRPFDDLFDGTSAGVPGGGMGGGFAMGGQALPNTSQGTPESADQAVSDSADQDRLGYLASLEIELPLRGSEYLFTTPGGDLELTARGIDQSTSRRFLQTLTIVLAAAFGWMLIRFFTARISKVSGALRIGFAAIIGMLGVASLVSGWLPIYGLLLILSAVLIGLTSGNEKETMPRQADSLS